MSDFARAKEGFRYRLGGMKTNAQPDSLPPDKYAYLLNIRATRDSSLHTRPGQALKFSTAGQPILNMRAYSALGTLNAPRTLAVDSQNTVYLDNGVAVGSLLVLGDPATGVSMIPFRPNQSPVPYMYIAAASTGTTAYNKYSAPSAANVVIQQKVGIAEPPLPPSTTLLKNYLIAFLYDAHGAPPLTAAGTAAAPATFTRADDVAFGVFIDPQGQFMTLQTTPGQQYQRFMAVQIGGYPFQQFLVQDVFAPLPGPIKLQSIFYYAGTTGRCVCVPASIAQGPGASGQSLYQQQLITSLRRGALVKINTEVCYVLSATEGPDGSVSFEAITTLAHAAGEQLSGVPAISLPNLAGVVIGTTVRSLADSSAVTTGIGTLTATVSVPFTSALSSFQPDDYIHISLNVSDLSALNEMKLLFDVGDGSFTQNFYYYTVRPSDIQSAVANTLTQLAAAQVVTQRATIDEEDAAAANNQGQTASSAQTPPGSSQWAEIIFPISALTRVGNDQTVTLANANSWQVLVNASASLQLVLNSLWIMGGNSPDVGDTGVPYLYRVRPRSQVTGAVGNPSPATRYGMNPRRQAVQVAFPSAAYDTQIDTWDVFRYGGTVTEFRFIGSTPITSPTFTDDFGDDAATAGNALDFDNFEPWPTIDLPLNVTASQVTGTIALVTFAGSTLNIERYLPGNLVQIGGGNVYTLRTRPTATGLAFNQYLLQFEENAGAMAGVALSIYEPAMANQILPYLWGPDVNGTVFACGDPLRPGTLYFAKGNNPDSAPDTYNLEIVPPSEPLQGGEVLNGLSFVASTERWWALYPQPSNPTQRYNFVQQPFTRGLAAPFGHCTDGQAIYWWAKDGIYSSAKGSLTDADLYNLFPHDGVVGSTVTYNGFVATPPDYSHPDTFRLAYCNGYLYATYQDSGGEYHTLVCDLRREAWSIDAYAPVATVFYHPEQAAGTIGPGPDVRYDELLIATLDGRVATQTDAANDLGGAISCVVAAAEFDGGDDRAPKQWGDFFLDSASPASGGLIVTPMSLGAPAAAPTTVPTSATRTRQPISVGGIIVSDFLGLLATWTDNFTVQARATTLYIWKPSFVIQPARMISWETFGTSFGLRPYIHIQEIEVAWVSTAPVTLSFAVVDGTAPAPITIPSSGGLYNKQLFTLTANKGVLYSFQATSTAPFQFFMEDFEVRVGEWGRTTEYQVFKRFGGTNVSPAVI